MAGLSLSTLVILTLLMTNDQSAQAANIKLLCNIRPPFVEQAPTIVELNEEAKTAIVRLPPLSLNGRPYSSGNTWGPMAAVFTGDTVTFYDATKSNSHFTINRLTGVLLNTDTKWDWDCHVGQRQF